MNLGNLEGVELFPKNWHPVRENTRNTLFGSRWSELYVQYKLVRNIKRGRHLIMSIFSDAPYYVRGVFTYQDLCQ